ncbi:hypothetical protein BDW75DRAFT_134687 [Aspergillus navahoensis]
MVLRIPLQSQSHENHQGGLSLGMLTTFERGPRLESDHAYPRLCFGPFSAHCLPCLGTCSPGGREGSARDYHFSTDAPNKRHRATSPSLARSQLQSFSYSSHFKLPSASHEIASLQTKLASTG